MLPRLPRAATRVCPLSALELNQLFRELHERQKLLSTAINKGTGGRAAAVLHKYVWAVSKDKLVAGTLDSALPGTADDKAKSITFTVTTINEDRDGDIVAPRGIEVVNFKRNPVWFFGHQENPLPIGKGVNPATGELSWYADEQKAKAVCYFDDQDEDAMVVYSKCKRGFLNATSIAFVPITAFRRQEKAHHDRDNGVPPGWAFDRIDLTEISVVGVPSNAGAIRDMLDTEKSFLSPRIIKTFAPYAAQARGKCFSGWCPPCARQKAKTGVTIRFKNNEWVVADSTSGSVLTRKTTREEAVEWAKDREKPVVGIDAPQTKSAPPCQRVKSVKSLSWRQTPSGNYASDHGKTTFIISQPSIGKNKPWYLSYNSGSGTIQEGTSGSIDDCKQAAERLASRMKSLRKSDDWTTPPKDKAEWLRRVDETLQRAVGKPLSAFPSDQVERLYAQGATFYQAPVALVTFMRQQGKAMTEEKRRDPDEMLAGGMPYFVSSSDDRDLLEQHAPAELRAWREAVAHWTRLSSTTDKQRFRRTLESAFDALKSAYNRLRQQRPATVAASYGRRKEYGEYYGRFLLVTHTDAPKPWIEVREDGTKPVGGGFASIEDAKRWVDKYTAAGKSYTGYPMKTAITRALAKGRVVKGIEWNGVNRDDIHHLYYPATGQQVNVGDVVENSAMRLGQLTITRVDLERTEVVAAAPDGRNVRFKITTNVRRVKHKQGGCGCHGKGANQTKSATVVLAGGKVYVKAPGKKPLWKVVEGEQVVWKGSVKTVKQVHNNQDGTYALEFTDGSITPVMGYATEIETKQLRHGPYASVKAARMAAKGMVSKGVEQFEGGKIEVIAPGRYAELTIQGGEVRGNLAAALLTQINQQLQRGHTSGTVAGGEWRIKSLNTTSRKAWWITRNGQKFQGPYDSKPEAQAAIATVPASMQSGIQIEERPDYVTPASPNARAGESPFPSQGRRADGQPYLRRSLNSTSGTAGGYTVPPDGEKASGKYAVGDKVTPAVGAFKGEEGTVTRIVDLGPSYTSYYVRFASGENSSYMEGELVKKHLKASVGGFQTGQVVMTPDGVGLIQFFVPKGSINTAIVRMDDGEINEYRLDQLRQKGQPMKKKPTAAKRAPVRKEMRECEICGRNLRVASDQTDPDVDDDEVVLDSMGKLSRNNYVCGQCLERAGKKSKRPPRKGGRVTRRKTVEEEILETPADEAAETPEEQAAEDAAGTELHDKAELEEPITKNTDPTQAPGDAMRYAYTHQHLSALKDWFSEQEKTCEPDSAYRAYLKDELMPVIDEHCAKLASDFDERYPDHDMKALAGNAEPTVDEPSGEAELVAEEQAEMPMDDNEVEMALDDEVTMEEDEQVEMSDSPVVDEAAEEILERYEAPPSDQPDKGRKGVRRKSYEIFYSSGGHGGPYSSLSEAVDAAKRMLRGRRAEHSIDIKERDAAGVGGYGRTVQTLTQDDVSDEKSKGAPPFPEFGKVEYRTPAGTFETWEEAAARVEAMDMDPTTTIEIVRKRQSARSVWKLYKGFRLTRKSVKVKGYDRGWWVQASDDQKRAKLAGLVPPETIEDLIGQHWDRLPQNVRDALEQRKSLRWTATKADGSMGMDETFATESAAKEAVDEVVGEEKADTTNYGTPPFKAQQRAGQWCVVSSEGKILYTVGSQQEAESAARDENAKGGKSADGDPDDDIDKEILDAGGMGMQTMEADSEEEKEWTVAQEGAVCVGCSEPIDVGARVWSDPSGVLCVDCAALQGKEGPMDAEPMEDGVLKGLPDGTLNVDQDDHDHKWYVHQGTGSAVLAGPFNTEEEANRAAERLERQKSRDPASVRDGRKLKSEATQRLDRIGDLIFKAAGIKV